MDYDETRASGTPQESGAVATVRAVLQVVHSVEADQQGKRYPLGDEDVTMGRDDHQASHRIWGTVLDENGHYQPIELE